MIKEYKAFRKFDLGLGILREYRWKTGDTKFVHDVGPDKHPYTWDADEVFGSDEWIVNEVTSEDKTLQ